MAWRNVQHLNCALPRRFPACLWVGGNKQWVIKSSKSSKLGSRRVQPVLLDACHRQGLQLCCQLAANCLFLANNAFFALSIIIHSVPVCCCISCVNPNLFVTMFINIWILSSLHSLLVGQFALLIVEQACNPCFFLWLLTSYQPHGLGEIYPNPKPSELIQSEVSIVIYPLQWRD